MALSIPAVLILLALSLLLRVDPLITVVWFLFGIYLLARLWTRRTVASLRVERQFTDRAFTGDEVMVTLKIRNESRLPVPWLQVGESLPVELTGTPFHDQAISLGGRRDQVFSYTLLCRQRGRYPIGPLRLQLGDLLGIEEQVVTEEVKGHMTVYPRILPLQRLGLPTHSALMTLSANTPLFEDATRVVGVRDYVPGDSPRRIHWTATARTGELMVKQYQPAIARETLMCLDLDWKHYPNRRYEATEHAIVVAASLANHTIVHEHLPVGLATEAHDPISDLRQRLLLPPRSERAHLMAILEVLARVQIATGGNFADLVREESVRLPWGATVVVITGELGSELAQTLVHLKRRGHATAVVLIQEPGSEASPQVNVAGMTVHRVWTDRDLAVMQ